MARGWKGLCPSCGKGRLFGAFLKPVSHCVQCSEDLSHQRADDFPPYIVITIVGHVIVAGILLSERLADWSMITQMILWPSLTLVIALLLLQPVKGAVIGWQWALRLHGFDQYD
jgi:uncharacterized protein (DUF983 family)